MKQITSSQNPFIKSLILLQEKAKARKQSGMFLIEGIREIELAIKGDYTLITVLFVPELLAEKNQKCRHP
jgi:TrmH family RNA methyltransferase